MTQRIPLTIGARYNRFTVLEEVSRTEGGAVKPRPVWYAKVRCQCGTEREIRSCHVRTGRIRSCGCLRTEAVCTDPQDRAVRYWINYSKNRKRSGNYRDFTLAFEVVKALIFMPCHYCGALPTPRPEPCFYERRYKLPLAPSHGLDRINPIMGYVPGNVVPCCSQCNTAKLDMSYDEFKGFIRRVAIHMGLVPGEVK